MRAQNVAGGVHGLQAVPVAGLAGDHVEVAVFLGGIGEALDALAGIGRTGLAFDLGDIATVGIHRMEEIGGLGADRHLVRADIGAGPVRASIIDDHGRDVEGLGRLDHGREVGVGLR